MGKKGIPVFDLLVFVAGLIGLKLAFNVKKPTIRHLKWMILISITIESIFLFTLYSVIDTTYWAGMSIYSVIIINAVISKVLGEEERHLEGFRLTDRRYIRRFSKS